MGGYVKYIKMVWVATGSDARHQSLMKQENEGVTKNDISTFRDDVSTSEVHGKEAGRILDNILIFEVELVNVVTKKEGEHARSVSSKG
jgi:hypothetical protein